MKRREQNEGGCAPHSVSVSYLEVGGRANSGVLCAIGNTIANVGSLLAPLAGAAIYAAAGNRWEPVFLSAAAGLAASALVFVAAISTTEEHEEEEGAREKKKVA